MATRSTDAGPASAADLQTRIDELAPWFHNLHLPGGLQTAPHHPFGDFPTFKWRAIEPHLPERLDGWRVLDIGCNAGFYSIELAQRGASVLAIDVDAHYLRQAEWAVQHFGVADRVELRQMQVYDVARLRESFDLVWFMGVFYHLRYPLLALDGVVSRVRRLLVFQTLTMPGQDVASTDVDTDDVEERTMFLQPGWPMMAFIENTYLGDPTNWWAANHAAVEAMLRSAGMNVIGRPAEEIYLCEPRLDVDTPRCNTPEFRSATGQREESR